MKKSNLRAIPIGILIVAALSISLWYFSGPVQFGVILPIDTFLGNEEYKAEIADFEARYSMKATNGSHYTVSILHILYEAIRSVSSSREDLKAYFETPRTYDTAYGLMTVDEYGDGATDRITLLQTLNGKMNTKEIIKFE
jgi:hypothetical protein